MRDRRLLVGFLVVALAVVVLDRRAGRPHVPTYGLMLHPFGAPVSYQTCGFHTGQDWFAPVGTPVFAVAPGRVVYVGPLWMAGPNVGRGPYATVIEHEGYHTTYSHNSVTVVEAGQTVAEGQKIGEVGDEGYSGWPHLHLEKVTAPWTGDWRRPFDGCAGYVDPGDEWRWF